MYPLLLHVKHSNIYFKRPVLPILWSLDRSRITTRENNKELLQSAHIHTKLKFGLHRLNFKQVSIRLTSWKHIIQHESPVCNQI